MPSVVFRGSEPAHVPGLPEWQPGEQQDVSEDAAEMLTRNGAFALLADAVAPRLHAAGAH